MSELTPELEAEARNINSLVDKYGKNNPAIALLLLPWSIEVDVERFGDAAGTCNQPAEVENGQ